MALKAEQIVKIVNQRGLHARAAAKFVRTVEAHLGDDPECNVRVQKDDMDVCGTSIMGLLMLSASKDTEIRIVVQGTDKAPAILEDLCALVTHRFGEDA